MSSTGTFGTAINCIDGRTQKAVTAWVREEAGVDYVDMVTEAGCDGVLHAAADTALIASLKKKVGISVNAHKSSIIVVAGHHDCAENPISKEEHAAHIKESVALVRSWGFAVKVIVGVWVNDRWEVERVC